MKFFIFLSFLTSFSMAQSEKLKIHVLRLKPGQDVLKEVTVFIQTNKISAASILSAVGSLSEAHLRYANNKDGVKMKGPLEVVSFSGTSGAEGSHFHLSVADSKGVTLGGHLLEGNSVFTTLEIVLGEYPDLIFKRTLDSTYGYKELEVQKK
jgi:predicted DNA-binding protein with PD1-like motif